MLHASTGASCAGRRCQIRTHATPVSSSTAAPAQLQQPTASGTRRHAIVVGGGVGGLVAAAKLARAGLRVTLLEQGTQVGGRCQSQQVQTEAGTFRFDTGPSLMLFPHVYKQMFESLGERMEDHVQVQRVEPAAYRVWFEGGSQLELLYNVPDMLQQLEGVEPGAGRAYLQWLAQARAALEVGTREFIERDFDSLPDFLDLRRLLPLLGQVDLRELLGQHHDRLAARFRDPRLRALLTFQDLYVGLTPYTAPGVFSLLAATEITDGVYYPLGGFQKVKDALASIAAKLGVEVRTGVQVTRILTSDDVSSVAPHSSAPAPGAALRATGVQLASGQQMQADLVVSNRDVPLTYQLLDHTQHGARQHKQLSAKQYSAAVIAYNWCVRGRLDRLAHHNVFLSGQYERSWQRATSPATLLPRPNFYCHCPTRTDPSAAPAGHDSVMVLLPVANIQQMLQAKRRSGSMLSWLTNDSGSSEDAADVSYRELVESGRLAIAKAFKDDGVCEDLLSQVVHEFVTDPLQWQDRYSIQHGAVFGLAHGLDQLALFRPALKDSQVRGLYLVGASARPGNGVPLVMLSADLAVRRVLQDVTAGIV